MGWLIVFWMPLPFSWLIITSAPACVTLLYFTLNRQSYTSMRYPHNPVNTKVVPTLLGVKASGSI